MKTYFDTNTREMVNLGIIASRYFDSHGTVKGFEEYVDNNTEYIDCEMVLSFGKMDWCIYTIYADKDDMTFVMCIDPEENNAVLDFYYGEPEANTTAKYAERGIKERYEAFIDNNGQEIKWSDEMEVKRFNW